MNTSAADIAHLSAQAPWPGLRAFSETESEFFFGRERETNDLLRLVQRSPVVLLYGQSGLGKTSLLQAGLFPKLKELDFLPLRLRLDHDEDALPLAEQVKQALASELDRAQVNAPRPGTHETLWEYFHRRDLDFWGPRNRLITPVIVFDQFEEVFALGQRSEDASAMASGERLFVEAEASYALAMGCYETGCHEKALQYFERTLRLTEPEGNSPLGGDLARLYVLSKIGLGRIEFQRYQFDNAREHFTQAIDFVETNGLGGEFKVLALQGVGMTREEDTVAYLDYERLDNISLT